MYIEAYEMIVEKYSNRVLDNMAWEQLSQELPYICNKYKNSLWQGLVLTSVDYLDIKRKHLLKQSNNIEN